MESRINHPEDYLPTSSSSGGDEADAEEANYESMLLDDDYDMGMEYAEFSELGVGLVELEGLEVDLEMDGLYDLADLDVDDVDW